MERKSVRTIYKKEILDCRDCSAGIGLERVKWRFCFRYQDQVRPKVGP